MPKFKIKQETLNYTQGNYIEKNSPSILKRNSKTKLLCIEVLPSILVKNKKAALTVKQPRVSNFLGQFPLLCQDADGYWTRCWQNECSHLFSLTISIHRIAAAQTWISPTETPGKWGTDGTKQGDSVAEPNSAVTLLTTARGLCLCTSTQQSCSWLRLQVCAVLEQQRAP